MENNQKEIILIEDLGYIKPKETSNYKKRYGIYRCFCGNEFKTQIASIKSGLTISCGCIKNKDKITHGLKKHKLYNVWIDIKRRCLNTDRKYYVNYGGRGITVCREWKDNFLSFYTWAMDNGYMDRLTIDRKDNDKGYSPDNCRWVNMKTQAKNTRKLRSTNKSGYRGVSWHKTSKKWIVQIQNDYNYSFLGYFDTALDGAKAYDKYVIENNLEHTRNFV